MEGLTVEARAPSLKEHWPRVKPALVEGTDQPPPVKRVAVAKPQGGIRQRGVPTVVERFIQPAVRPGRQAPWEPPCSESSVGVRPGGNAQQAGTRAPSYRQAGDPWGVEMALEKVFDRVTHDKVMREVAKRVRDRRGLPRLPRVLKAGAMEDDARHETVDGGPQGGPLAPLLSNLIRDRRDREWERRGPRFVRYADDRHGYVRSKRAGSRV